MDNGDGTGVEILLVEDNPGDIRLIEEALEETNSTLHTTSDGREALNILHQRHESTDAPHPDIVLLDLNLPKVDGTQVLEEIRRNSELDDLRVIIITSAQKVHTDLEQYNLDANDFITKPSDPEEFMALVRSSIFD